MNANRGTAFAWWKARRRRYNVGLVVAGLAAFLAYATIGFILVPADAGFEITFFSVFFQGVGYLLLIGVANVCYFLGPISEQLLRPTDPLRYRRRCYGWGFWLSVLLPFSALGWLVVAALWHPDTWKLAP